MGIGLSQLGSMIADQFLQGENSDEQRTLKSKLDGKDNEYGKLGEFAKQIDQTAQRNYLEQGYLDNSFNSQSAKMREVIFQQPEATVFVRKKMYTSLANNYATEYMSEEESLTYLAMDKLFANKARQISAYEKLCKIQKASQKMGEVNESLLPLIIGFDDVISSTVGAFSTGPFSLLGNFGDTIRKLKAVYNYSNTNFYTTWIEDVLTPSYLRYGSGNGVIEFTNFTNINTNVAVSTGQDQSFSISFEDPYNLMTVTMSDIENAISEVVNINNSFGPKTDADGQELFGSNYSIGVGREISGDLVQKNIDLLNKVRAARGVSPISFKIDPNSIYGRRVIAIIDRLGQEIPFNAKNVGIPWSSGVTVEAPYLQGGASLGEEGLATSPDKKFRSDKNSNVKINVSSELNLFSDVIKSIFTKINLDKNTDRSYDFVNGDDLINYIRKKLTFYFGGKNIIQPMDLINIYISSKTNTDNKIMSGIKDAFTGFGLINNFSNQMQQTIGMFNGIFSPSSSLDLQMEKSLILGENNIPNYIWLTLRDQFTSEKEGCHVYAGIFKSIKTSFSDGSYTVTANGSDNTYYLALSQVNFNPGAVNTTGNFYDPLTIYQTKFDSVYNESDELSLPLLKENQEIMNDIQHPLRVVAGPKSGATIKDGIIPSEVEFTQTGYSSSGQKVIYAPDGLVYKWKDGIKTLELRGSASDIAASPSFSQQSAVTDVLANQDVMNCVSLLVTGTPYNYYTYYKAGIALGNLKRNSDRTALASSRLTELQESISRTNLIWGNFIPYKSLSVSSAQFSEMMSLKSQELIKNQTSLNKLYRDADILKNSLITQSLNLDSGTYNLSAISEKYKGSLESLYSRIDSAQQKFITSISDPNFSHFSIIGNDISFDSDYFVNNGGDDPTLQNKRQIRRKNQFLTRRLSWKVRENADSNLFIVDDSYDKNNDLLSFEGNINGQKINLFGTELSTVFDKVKSAAGALNMEFFADTQGHLRIRPPQYNKMPSSVFLTLLKNKKSRRKVQIFPKFLNSLLLDQLKNLYNKLSATEDEIRMYCLLLGIGNSLTYNGDDPAITYIRGTETSNSAVNKKNFNFLSSPETGQIIDYKSIHSIESNFNTLDNGLNSSSFLAIKQIKDQAQSQINIKNTFDIASRIGRFKSDLNSIIRKEDDFDDQLSTFEKSKRDIEKLVSRIFEKTGEIIKPEKYVNPLVSEAQLLLSQIALPKLYTVPSFEINNQISKKLNERQKLVKQLYFFAKSTYEFNALDNADDAVNYLSNPNSENAPEIFDYLIEDESYDDLGPGSGSRYVIKNSQIISYEFSENLPSFTGVTVTGRIAKNFPAEQSSTDWKPLPSGGNPLTSSSALDYDLWKMYGYKWGGEKSYPLLTNPQSQTTPLAVGLLMEERKKIFTASVTIIGNEYMQPGEVVFLEQIGMLFYVEKVAHTFNYSNDGGTFTTSLTLSYGHFPGEYIPNLTDLVGKLLYVNRDSSNISVRKGLPNVAGKSAGAIAMINRDVSKNFDKANPLLANNIRTINRIAAELRRELASNSQANTKTVLNILIYKSSAYSNICRPLAEELKKILLGISSNYKIEDVSFKPFNENEIAEIQEVDLSDQKEKRGPSRFAYGIAGNLISKKTFVDIVKAAKSPSGKAQLRNKYVCNYIVDCFVKTYPK